MYIFRIKSTEYSGVMDEDEEQRCVSCGRSKGAMDNTNWDRHVTSCNKKKNQREEKADQKKEKAEDKKKRKIFQKENRKRSNTSNALTQAAKGCHTMAKFYKTSNDEHKHTDTVINNNNHSDNMEGVTVMPEVPEEVIAAINSTEDEVPEEVIAVINSTEDEVPEVIAVISSTEDDVSEPEVIAVISSTEDEVNIEHTVKCVLNDIVNQVYVYEENENESNNKCSGFCTGIGDIYKKLPCHILSDLGIVIENQLLHNLACNQNNYILFPGNNIANKCCSDLQYSPKLRKILDRGKIIYPDKDIINMNHIYLSHSQLSEKAKSSQEEKRLLRLKLMNSSFKNSKLCATLTLHERFVVLISENNIPRLQQLVNVALRNNRSITHIVTKVLNVIDGIYMPNPCQSDKDLAFLVLKFGGPSLLNILYRAGILPSVSTAYKMAKECPPIVSSVKSSVTDCFDKNILISDIGKSLVSLKLDETYVTPILSYNQRDNQAYGTCYQHGHGEQLELNNYEDCENIQQLIQNDNLHIPKECLVAGLASLNENKPMQPLLMWPTCSKKDEDGTIQLISEVNDRMKEKYEFPLMNICTDGDGTRRKVANRLMQYDVDERYPWYFNVCDLPLVDYFAGPDGETVNFDPKHMCKRCWVMLLREKIVLKGITLIKALLKTLLAGNSYDIGEESLFPKDKQNVKSATTFLLAFIEATQKTEFPYHLVSIQLELKLLGEVFSGLLAFYVFTEYSITEQIKAFSTATYILYYLYKEYKTSIMPSQLYHDLQTSFIDALFCCGKSKEFCPNEPMYLVLDGTDLLERFFGNIRMRFKGGNYNTLEMINSARSMQACDKILMVDHPEWVKKSRVQRRLALDYSNPAVWKEDKLILENVNIRAVWKSGYHKALSMVPENAATIIENALTTLRCPIKKDIVVGIDQSGQDWSRDDPDEDVEEESANSTEVEEDDDVNLSEIIQEPDHPADPFFILDGKRVYKTTCLKKISSSQQLSKDRLRRVQGMSKYPGEVSSNCDVDSFLINGDPVLLTNSKDGPRLANIVKISKANQTLKQIDITHDNSDQMKDIELTLTLIDTELVGNKLFWKGTTSDETIRCIGENCLPIKPSVDLHPPEGLTKYFFDINLIRDLGVHLQLSRPTAVECEQQAETHSTNQSLVKKKCFICSKLVPWSEMRCHVGKHILKNDRVGPNVCGFCGRNTCAVTLKQTSSRGKNLYYSIVKKDGCWGCEYYFPYGKGKKFNKKTNPCTNRLLRCPLSCVSDVWRYNFPFHFDEKHSNNNEDFPEEMVIEEAEKTFLKK